ncbi:MAG: osmoprotectant transport system ATP-binding protein [Marivirga sp.]|jgi:osmoprotectant transport system ATP-binding protein
MIEFIDVGKKYPLASASVLEHINIAIHEGEVLVLLGASGSGKTTLMKMVNGLERPTKGQVTYRGESISEIDLIQLRRKIGYAIQNVGLFPHYTVFENIATVLRLHSMRESQITERVTYWMEKLGLDFKEQAYKMPHQLSGGQAQRVGLARAMANSPELLLMDEPFSALDPQLRKSIRMDFKKIQQQEKTTVIMVTHDLLEAIEVADRICFIANKAVQTIAHPADFINTTNNQLVTSFIQADKFQASLAACTMKDLYPYLSESSAIFRPQEILLSVLAKLSLEQQKEVLDAYFKWEGAKNV